MLRPSLVIAAPLVVFASLAVAPLAAADEETPVIKLASPLGVAQGTTTKVTLRGLKLDNAQGVECSDGKSTAKIIGQGNANVPNQQNAQKIGDRQVEIELTIPEDAPAGELGLVVVTPAGKSEPFRLLVGGEFPLVAEQEPNDGFRQAQAIPPSQIVEGSIHGDRNVDCYVVEGQAGQSLTIEVLAERRGSGLDALLSVYNERAQWLASHDDMTETRDARLEFTFPAAGKYFIVVQDAHDLGGPAHPYRLIVRPGRAGN